MELLYKPDFDRAARYWDVYWQKTIIDRPIVCVRAPKKGGEPAPAPIYMDGILGNWDEAIARFEHYARNTYWGGDIIPFVDPSWGPDQFALFFGGDFTVGDGTKTSWIHPYVENWDDVSFDLLEGPDSFFTKTIQFYERFQKHADGKYLLGMLDLHSNLGCLSAMRGPQPLCFDLYDYPDEVEAALKRVRSKYAPIYERVFKAGKMDKYGSVGWIPFYARDRYAAIQCDFIALISNDIFRKLALPSIREEAEYLDHCIFHLDGPDALRHVDDILDIDAIDAIQWVPGDGRPKSYKWMELLQKMQKAGKGLHIQDWTFDDIKQYYKELRPEGLVFDLKVDTQDEADEIIEWFTKNT